MSLVSTLKPKLHTARDVERLDAQGQRYELIRGELLPMSPTSGEHGRETMTIAAIIWNFVDEQNLGDVYAAETGFLLTKKPDTVLAPDVAFVRRDRLTNISTKGFADCVPDLVVETRSPSDSQRSVAAKLKRWIDFGVHIVIDLNPQGRTLTVYRPGCEPETLGPDDTLHGYDVLPASLCPCLGFFGRLVFLSVK